MAHDFVIPSAYQMILNENPSFLGNWVNFNANHFSGGRTDLAGKQSEEYLLEILERMVKA
jgi:hypothetical protein